MGDNLFSGLEQPRQPRQMERLALDCPDADILAVARRWTERLAAEDYLGAWEMLLHRPGEVWAPSPEVLQARIVNYGSPKPIPGEPVCVVTSIGSATGTPWRSLPKLMRAPGGSPHRFPGYRGRLDWELPLNGEWSDLIASFDLVEDNGQLVLVLAALRVP